MKRISFIFLLLSACARLVAQEFVIDIKHWQVKDGLGHRQVNCLSYDREGFIWLGTQNGLNRFDGSKFLWVTHERDSLPFNTIARMVTDVNGNIWLAGPMDHRNALTIFDPRTRKCHLYKGLEQMLNNLRVDVLYAMQDSAVVVRTAHCEKDFVWHPQRGVMRLPMPQGHVMIGVMPEANLIVTLNDSNQLVATNTSGAVVKKIASPFAKGAYAQWTSRKGLLVRDVKSGDMYAITPGFEVKAAWHDYAVLKASPTGDYFNTGIEGMLWSTGTLHAPRKGMVHDFVKEGYPELNNGTRGILPDKTNPGRIWMVNNFGLYLLSITRNKFRQYATIPPLGTLNRNAHRGMVCQDTMLFCCNEGYGLFKINTRTGHSEKCFSCDIPGFAFYGLSSLSDGGIAGTFANVIFTLSKEGKRTDYAMPDSLMNGCWYVKELRPGLLLCGMNEGLAWVKLNAGGFAKFTGYNGFNELASSLVLHIAPGRDGLWWVCCNKGLFCYDTASGLITARYSAADTGKFFLPATAFQHFFEDAQGIFWLGTTDGLIRWDRAANSSRLYTRVDGLADNNIYAVYEDSHEHLWLSSDYGIMRFHKATAVVKSYLQEDGITYNEFNRLSHCQGRDGTIFFGSMMGTTALDPAIVERGEGGGMSVIPLVITAFRQFNGATNVLEDRTGHLLRTNEVTLRPDDRFFNLEVELLNYSEPDQTTFYWKIDGADTGWNAQKERIIRLGSLPYGSRYLHVKAQAADGTWGVNDLNIRLVVLPPFYLQAWFLAACVLLFIAIGAGLYSWRVYRLKKENQRLDRVVQEKTGDLQRKTGDLETSLLQKNVLLKEVHHRVKNNLQIVSSLLQMQSRGIEDERAKKALQEGRNRIMTMAAIHQNLYKKETLETLELRTFADDIFRQISGLYITDDRQVTFENKVNEIYLDIDNAVPLGLILNELLTNSFKYAFGNVGQPLITLELKKEDELYCMTYRDNGPGLKENMDIGRLSSLGMQLITGLTEQLKGAVRYGNEGGACFFFTFALTSKRT